MTEKYPMLGPDPAFTDWNRRVIEKMGELVLGQYAKRVSIVVDIKIPYRLGWSVDRTARALLNLDYRDCVRLNNLMMKGERNAPTAEQTDEPGAVGDPKDQHPPGQPQREPTPQSGGRPEPEAQP